MDGLSTGFYSDEVETKGKHMFYAFLVYWVIAGVATWGLPDPSGAQAKYPIAIFILCMLTGGVIVPARFITKAVK